MGQTGDLPAGEELPALAQQDMRGPAWRSLPQLPPRNNDPRLRSVVYDPGSVVQLSVAPNYQLTILLSGGERVLSVAVGDSSGWQVAASRTGDSIFVKPLSANSRTNMTVISDARVYAFDLVPGSEFNSPYIVRFVYPNAEEDDPAPSATSPVAGGAWKIGGARAVRPETIRDDGERTYIAWAPGRVMPAVFGVSDTGNEMLIDGYMRDGVFTIDRVYKKLVFRLDRSVATANRK